MLSTAAQNQCIILIQFWYILFVGVEIVQVRAEDADFGQNAAIDYNIVSGAQNTFDININTGVISRRTGAVLDFDVTPSYVLMVS